MKRTVLTLLMPLCACAAARPCPDTQHALAQAASAAEAPSAEAGADAPREQVLREDATRKKTAPHGKAMITPLAQGENAFVGKLELLPNATVPEHQDPSEEYIHVLSGQGVMVMNGKPYDIAPGTTIFMPAGATVSYQNGSEPLVGIQVFAGPGPAQKYEAWK